VLHEERLLQNLSNRDCFRKGNEYFESQEFTDHFLQLLFSVESTSSDLKIDDHIDRSTFVDFISSEETHYIQFVQVSYAVMMFNLRLNHHRTWSILYYVKLRTIDVLYLPRIVKCDK